METSISLILSVLLLLDSFLPAGTLAVAGLPFLARAAYISVPMVQSGGSSSEGAMPGLETDLDCPVDTTYYYNDDGYQIQRTTLDTGTEDLSIYFEVPVFSGGGPGYQLINDFFQDLREEFLSDSSGMVAAALEMVNDLDYPPMDRCLYELDAAVMGQTGRLISVSIFYSWYMGGVFDYGSSNYTFDTVTGDRLYLTDVTDVTEGELRDAVRAALAEQDGGNGDIDESVAERDLDSYDFYVQDGEICLSFDKYEASYGAYGAFDVELSVPLGARWDQGHI